MQNFNNMTATGNTGRFRLLTIGVIGFLTVSYVASLCNGLLLKDINQRTPACKCTYIEAEFFFNCNKAGCYEVPSGIPDSTRILSMASNTLSSLKNGSFWNLKHLTHLYLNNCRIEEIERGTFDNLTELQVLNLSRNSGMKELPEAIFSKLGKLSHLLLSRTRKESVFNTRLLNGCQNLSVLMLGENQLMKFPRFCDGYNKSLVPKLKELWLELNNVERINHHLLCGLRSVEKLLLGNNRIFSITKNAFKNMRNLSHLELDRNVLNAVKCGAFNSNSLKFLSLSDTQFRFTKRCSKEEKLFEGSPNLEILNISHSLGLFNETYPFQFKNKLVELNLQSIFITNEILSNLTKNVRGLRHLNLYDNDLGVLEKKPFENLALETLRVGHNWLLTVNITSLPMRVWKSLKAVDFSGNPLFCDCSIVWFRRWITNPPRNVTIENLDRLICTAPFEVKGRRLKDLDKQMDKTCFRDKPDEVLPLVLLVVLVASSTSLVASLLYRFRWHLRYWHFKRQTRQKFTDEDVDPMPFRFDAFISYCESDSRWVIDQLCPRLENDFKLRVCIEDRNWPIGEDVIVNIMNSIEQSRKSVFIVSNAFAESHWCHFGMTMAQMRLLETDRDNLILVLLEEIADRNMNPRLQLQMQKKDFIEWTQESRIGQQLFWEKLQLALSKQPGSVFDSVPPRELFESV